MILNSLTVKKRTPWDGAHSTGDSLWQDKMQSYQSKLDPEGHFKFDQNARWNGALVSSRTVDAGVSGTTAHGGHGNAVNEISWRARPDLNGPSFYQSIEAEFDAKVDALDVELGRM